MPEKGYSTERGLILQGAKLNCILVKTTPVFELACDNMLPLPSKISKRDKVI